MARNRTAFQPVPNPSILTAHNIRVLQNAGLDSRRIAIELRLSESVVAAVIGGGIAQSKKTQASRYTASSVTLERAEQAKRIIARYKARREYASGRDISKELGLRPNWLACNICKARTNANYAWALEVEDLLNELAPFGDPSNYKGNNIPKNLRGKRR